MPSVQIICPPNSLLTGSVSTAITGAIDRAFRRGNIGGTLDGNWLTLVRTGTYVWFATSSSLGLWGTDPATHTSNLGSGYRCVLSGNQTADEVAEHLRYTVSLIPNFSASRINSTASLSGTSVSASLCHAGIAWNSRGWADIWGLRQRSSTGNNGNTNAVVSQHLPVPGISGARLKGMRIGRTVASGQIRAAIYYAQGGSSTTDPTNSVLFYDFGQTQGNITEGYDYVYVSGTYPVIPTTGALWLTFKGDGGQGNNLYMLQGSLDANNNNFTVANTFITALGEAPTVAFPTTYAYAGTNPFAIVMDAAICFDSPPFAGAGDLEFRYGTHVSASAFGSQVGLTGTLSMRGVPPPINGLRVVSQSIGVGTTHTTQYRMGLYAGGSTIAAPLSATLINDSGQTSGAGTSQYLTLAAANSFAYLPSSASIIAPMIKNNDGGISVLFHSNPTTDPDYDPTDWLFASEYETFSTASGGQMNPDETVAFQSLFATGSNDQRPGNLPSFHLLLRVDGFALSEGGADPTGSAPQTLDALIASASFSIGSSNLTVSPLSLASTIQSSTFILGAPALSLSTVSLASSVVAPAFSLGTSLLSPGIIYLSSSALSPSFILGTPTINPGASQLIPSIGSLVWSVGAATISGGETQIVESSPPQLFTISQICRRLV